MRRATLLVLVLQVVQAWGQSVTGAIAGIVSDPKGAVIPGAHVIARNTATNAQTTQTTDENGYYRLANLEPGQYAVQVEAQGFRKASVPPQQLSAVGALRLDLAMEIGQVTE